jgi:hypothetical protein
MRAPFVIDFREFTGRICVFNKVDLVFHFLFHHGRASFVDLPGARRSKRAQMGLPGCVSGPRKAIRAM